MIAELVTSDPRAELIRRVNDAFDAARDRYGLTSDQALARHLGVSPKTISFWRNGRWHPAGEALISVLVNTSSSKEAA